MPQKRNLFQKIFGKTIDKISEATTYRLLNSWDSSFTDFSGNEWDISIVRAAVGAFARNAAKVSPRHIRRGDDTYTYVCDGLDHLLRYKPNDYMTAYAFYYRVAVMYKLNNNAFIYPVWDGARLVALYPIMANRVELVEYKGVMYCNFKFATGKSHTVPYSDIIHIRNYYYDNDIFGSDNNALLPVLQTAHKFNESMSKFAELIAVIRGILKIVGAPKNEDLTARRDDFIRDNLNIQNNGSGIVVTDNKYDYTPITDKSVPIPSAQLEYIKNAIFDYFGSNEDIVQNKFDEDGGNAYYEGEIEPFYIQLSQAMTNGLFTDKECGYGNEILCEANRLQYASIEKKISASTFLTNIGAATLDQILEIFNMAPIGGEEGKRRVQTLNAASTAIVDDYQLGKPREPQPQEPQPKEDEGQNANSQGT